MSKVNYLDIIKRAIAITWKNRHLWWFGLFVALTGAGNSFSYSFGKNNNLPSNAGQKVLDFFSGHIGLVVLAVISGLILFLIFTILGIIGRGALIKSVDKISKNELSDFKTGFRSGKKYFWRILGAGIILTLFIVVAVLILATPIIFLFLNKAYLLGILLVFMALIILIPLVILATYLRIYGYIYIVLGEVGVWTAIENSYMLLRKNLGVSLIMGLIFMAIGAIYGLSILMLFVPIAAIFFFIGSILYLALKGIGIAITVFLGVITILAIALFLRSIYETFAQAVWVFLF